MAMRLNSIVVALGCTAIGITMSGHAVAQAMTNLPVAAGADSTTDAVNRDTEQPVGAGSGAGEFKAPATRLGTFLIQTSIAGSIEGNDNVYLQKTRPESDFIFGVTPELQARSDWARHLLQIDVVAQQLEHVKYGRSDGTNAHVSAIDRFDIDGASALTGNASFDRSIVGSTATSTPNGVASSAGTSPNSVSGDAITFNRYIAGLRYDALFNRILVALSSSVSSTIYEKTASSTGSVLNESYRNGTVVKTAARVGYQISPVTYVFTEGAVNDRHYEAGGLDSTGYSILTGVSGEITRLIKGEIGVGYLHQDYKYNLIKSVDDVAVSAKLNWYPTDRLTVTAIVDRSPGEPSIINQPASVALTSSLGADYEIRRDILLNVAGSYVNATFEPTATQKSLTQDLESASIRLTKLINRNLSVVGSYVWSQRTASSSAEDYARNQALVTLRAQF
jgi:hypothetical protein